MSYGLFKLATLGGVGSAVGGIAVGSSIFSGSKEESSTYKTAYSNIENKDLKSEPTSSPNEQTESSHVVTKRCIIFVTDKATGTGENMKISKILKKYEDLNEFLKAIEGSNDNFKKDVSDACNGKKPNIHPSDKDVIIYVYEKENKQWNYTRYLQKQDWSKNATIKGNSSGVKLD